MSRPTQSLDERLDAAFASLAASDDPADPLDMMSLIGWLHWNVFESWRSGRIAALENSLPSSRERRRHALDRFTAWASERGMQPIMATYYPHSRHHDRELAFTVDGDPELERLYRTRYVQPGTPEKKLKQVQAKATKPPELVVFIPKHPPVCTECDTQLEKGEMIFLEGGKPLCLTCADLDHLVFLPGGDATLSRRARKYSPLNAIVLEWSRSAKHYHRRGLLVDEAAADKAETECLGDEEQRLRRRELDADRRATTDADYVNRLACRIRELYPRCPAITARVIAEHTGRRGSGRVGRSAAAREELADAPIRLAVIAHVRHTRTNYDVLLMGGGDRLDARRQVASAIQAVLEQWERA